MRRSWVLALVGIEGLAEADERPFEASAFVGVGVFSDDNELGNSWAPEQVPNTAPVVGARLGWLVLPALAGPRDGVHLGLAVEGELSFASAYTESFEGERSRTSYFAPVFSWRAHGLLQLGGLRAITPHLIVGAGGETIRSSSPYMAKETDPLFYWGPGASVALTQRWRLRLDLRHGLMAARDDGVTSALAAQLGLAARFGGSSAPVRTRVEVVVKPPTPKPPEPPVVITPPPDPDPDHDGVLAEADQCPDTAEDTDQFADDDGCPDLDNDNDGFEDTRDACPLAPETKNGVDDADGCADTVPDNVNKALATGAKLKFERNRARVTPAAQATLRPLYLMLLAHPDVKIRIVGHPEKAGAEDLAKRRADAVKWWLVDQGVIEGRIAISLGDVAPSPIELSLRAD